MNATASEVQAPGAQFILRGIAGSQAHGLATASSDIDMRGVFSFPTSAFWSLRKPETHFSGTDPDFAYQELEKFLTLAANGNPSILEVLWLNSYEEIEPDFGHNLLEIRTSVLSADRVQSAYLGYAHAQFAKLAARGGTFSASTSNRTNKHARHIFRLLEQGHHLYATGELNVRVGDPEQYLRYADMSIEQLTGEYDAKRGQFACARTALPEQPDYARINAYLADYRAGH